MDGLSVGSTESFSDWCTARTREGRRCTRTAGFIGSGGKRLCAQHYRAEDTAKSAPGDAARVTSTQPARKEAPGRLGSRRPDRIITLTVKGSVAVPTPPALDHLVEKLGRTGQAQIASVQRRVGFRVTVRVNQDEDREVHEQLSRLGSDLRIKSVERRRSHRGGSN